MSKVCIFFLCTVWYVSCVCIQFVCVSCVCVKVVSASGVGAQFISLSCNCGYILCKVVSVSGVCVYFVYVYILCMRRVFICIVCMCTQKVGELVSTNDFLQNLVEKNY